MSNTINKLNESEFFLTKLKQNKDEVPKCDYYLNAFVGSARSVLWIMKAEYSSDDKWVKWYGEKSTTENEYLLLKGITDMRNRSLKREPLKIEQSSMISYNGKSVDVMEEIKRYVKRHGEDKTYTLTIENNTENNNKEMLINNGTLSIHGTVNIYDTVKEFKDSNIVEKCEEYFNWLKSIVKECDMLFNKRNVVK